MCAHVRLGRQKHLNLTTTSDLMEVETYDREVESITRRSSTLSQDANGSPDAEIYTGGQLTIDQSYAVDQYGYKPWS